MADFNSGDGVHPISELTHAVAWIHIVIDVPHAPWTDELVDHGGELAIIHAVEPTDPVENEVKWVVNESASLFHIT